jgi:phenylacetic acid degradation protein
MPAYEIDGVVPVVDPEAFVHPDAVLIGDVVIAAGAYIGPCASLRGDFGAIVIEEGANVQDSAVVHTFPGRTTRIGVDGHIGHGAVLHGCEVGRGVLVGINAVVLDEAELGEYSFVGASSFLRAGFRLPARHLAIGVPARVVRELTEDELAWKANGSRVYQELAVRSRATMRVVTAETELRPSRRTLPHGRDRATPLHELHELHGDRVAGAPGEP